MNERCPTCGHIPSGPKRRSVEERFWNKVGKRGPTDCWLWTGSVDISSGYARIALGGTTHRNPRQLVHRFSYELAFGPIPKGLTIDHVKERGCTSRLCVNPAHLEAVTLRVNLMRTDSPPSQNAKKTTCPKGHEYTVENTASYNGKRYCVACRRTGVKPGEHHRKKTHCPSGHPYDAANTYTYPDGRRKCRTCQRHPGSFTPHVWKAEHQHVVVRPP